MPSIGGRDRNEFRLEVQAEARSRIVAEPAGQTRQISIGGMSLMDEDACNRTGTSAEIFIGTPDREIDIPVVQEQRHVPDSVGKINPNGDSMLLGCRRNCRNVEQLTREKIHTADQYHRKLTGMLFD